MTQEGSPSETIRAVVLASDAGPPFVRRIRLAFEMLRLRTPAIDALLADEGAFVSAAGVAALAGVAVAAGAGANPGGHVLSVMLWLLWSALFTAGIHIAATTVFGASGDYVRTYRAVGHTYLVMWIAGVPLVYGLFPGLLWIWQLVVAVRVAERAYRLERRQAIGAIAIPTGAALLVALLLGGLVAAVALWIAWLF